MFDFFKVLADEGAGGTTTPDPGAGAGAGGSNPWLLVGAAVLLVIFIVMSVVQNKQRKKQMAEEQEKKDRLCAGTTVITIGGVMGTVESVNDDDNSFVLNTAGTIMKFDKRAIYQMTLPEEVQKQIDAEKAAEAERKGKKTK